MTATDAQAEALHDLENLAAEMTTRGYPSTLHTPPGRLPYLDVANPHAAILSERVYASTEAYWFSWAERIAGCDEVNVAAGILAQVLRTADGK
jgi:hypothetical protein